MYLISTFQTRKNIITKRVCRTVFFYFVLNWLKEKGNALKECFIRNPFYEHETELQVYFKFKTLFFFKRAPTALLSWKWIFPILLGSTRVSLCCWAACMLLFAFCFLQLFIFICSYLALAFFCDFHFNILDMALLHSFVCSMAKVKTLKMRMCNSYSCGCATVFGIHQRIYQPTDSITYIFFWFWFGNPLVMSNQRVKNLYDNSFTHTHMPTVRNAECGMCKKHVHATESSIANPSKAASATASIATGIQNESAIEYTQKKKRKKERNGWTNEWVIHKM